MALEWGYRRIFLRVFTGTEASSRAETYPHSARSLTLAALVRYTCPGARKFAYAEVAKRERPRSGQGP